MPSTSDHAAASQFSVSVFGPSWCCSTTSSSPASAFNAFLSILPLPVSGSVCRQWKADGTIYFGSDSPSRFRAAGLVAVAAAATHSAGSDVTGRAERRRCQVLVDDIDVYIGDGSSKRNTFTARHAVHDLGGGVVAGLGQAVRIHRRDPRL